jgi:hypothetical protein
MPTSLEGILKDMDATLECAALAISVAITLATKIAPQVKTACFEIFPSSPKQNEDIADFTFGRFHLGIFGS